MNDYDDLEDDRYGWDDELYDDYNPCDDDPCSHCGIWCDHWGGDGLCLLQIEQQAMEDEEYHKNYLTENVPCPVCGKYLNQYEIPTDKLWTWPGGFYNPMIALEIYSAYGVAKGEVHHKNNVYHVWIGDGKYREEKLIKLRL